MRGECIKKTEPPLVIDHPIGRWIVLFVFGLIAAARLGTADVVPAPEFRKGEILDKVVCLDDPGQSYALYLPSSFDRAKTWPVLFLFDSGARGSAGVKAFRTAAETYGWILIGSNNSHNGPLNDSLVAAKALWRDSQKRLPVDQRRVYASGFSGGARIASIFPQAVGLPVAGIIGCGAGLAVGLAPGDLRAAAYFGLAGFRDFNYDEMKRLDAALDSDGLPHRIFFFEGIHDWPDPASCLRAAGWMEAMAIKGELRPDDKDLFASILGRELDEARILEDAGRPFWAVERLDAAGRLAGGRIDLPGLADRLEAMKASKAYRQFLKEENTRDKRTERFVSDMTRAFVALENDERGRAPAVRAALRAMGIEALKKEAAGSAALEDRSLASRLLFICSFSAQGKAGERFNKDETALGADFLDLAIAACEPGLPREKYLYFSRAEIAALMGDRKGALEFLAGAVDKGFVDLDLLETSKELDRIKDEPRYRDLLEKIKR